MTMERPTSVKVGPFTWTILYDDEALRDVDDTDGGARLGITLHRQSRIYVAVSGRTEQSIREVVVHELLHAIHVTYTIKPSANENTFEREEENVQRLAAPLLAVIQDNPVLMKYLFSTEEG